jgi:hypothetical protein
MPDLVVQIEFVFIVIAQARHFLRRFFEIQDHAGFGMPQQDVFQNGGIL